MLLDIDSAKVSCRVWCDSDLDELAIIEREAGFSGWNNNQLKQSFVKDTDTGFVLLDEQAIVGHAIFQIILPESELLTLTIKKVSQGRGFGKYLLAESLKQLMQQKLETCFLEVGHRNTAAIRLYERLGFKQIGTRTDYYSKLTPKQDALLYQLDLMQ